MSAPVHDNTTLQRFELNADGRTAVAYYELAPGIVTFTHTEVPPDISGRGVGSALVRGALQAVRARGLKVASRCSFVSAYLGKHAEFNDLIR
jgi:predicted GNAT family acetyltransferase